LNNLWNLYKSEKFCQKKFVAFFDVVVDDVDRTKLKKSVSRKILYLQVSSVYILYNLIKVIRVQQKS
jgi:hypothetical protein